VEDHLKICHLAPSRTVSCWERKVGSSHGETHLNIGAESHVFCKIYCRSSSVGTQIHVSSYASFLDRTGKLPSVTMLRSDGIL
jgi:hypothetical protein